MCGLSSLFREVNFRKLTKNSGQIFCINGRKKTGGPWKKTWEKFKKKHEIGISILCWRCWMMNQWSQKLEITTSKKDPILWQKRFIITMSVKGTTYTKKINPATLRIVHWKGFLVTKETKLLQKKKVKKINKK